MILGIAGLADIENYLRSRFPSRMAQPSLIQGMDAAAALLGIGGATVGGSVGNASEGAMDEGIPKDDVFFYRDQLKQKRSLVVVSTQTDEGAASVRSILDHKGAEDIETARKQWETAHGGGLKRAS